MGTGTSSGKPSGSANRQAPQFNTQQQITAAKAAVSGIKNAQYQNVTVTRPKDGHRLEIDIQRIKNNSASGSKYSYRITIDDNDNINEYGNPERLWYTYRSSLADAKKDARRYLGI